MKIHVLITLVILSSLQDRGQAWAPGDTTPNIVLILADDMGNQKLINSLNDNWHA